MMFLLVLLLQAPSVDEMVRRLDSDDVGAREEAEERLVEAGAAAQGALERLAETGSAEGRVRAQRLLLAIRRVPLLGTVRRVSLRLADKPFREALAALQAASGFEVRVDKAVEDRRVSLSVDSAPWLEALDSLCRAHGAARLDQDRSVDFLKWVAEDRERRARFTVRAAAWGNPPVRYVGPFRVSMAGVVIRRGEGVASPADVHIACLWQPNVIPFGNSGPSLYTVLDGAGMELARRDLPGTDPTPEAGWFDSLGQVWLDRAPAVDEDRLRLVHGKWRLWFGTRQVRRLEKPQVNVGSTTIVGDVDVTLEECGGRAGGLAMQIKLQARKSYPWNRLGDVVNIRLLDGAGARVYGRDGSLGFDALQTTWSCRLDRVTLDRIAAVELTSYTDIFRFDVPFTFRDVRIPKR